MTNRNPLHRRHRFPAEITVHAVWLSFRFPLSPRMVEDMLVARGTFISHQTVRLQTAAPSPNRSGNVHAASWVIRGISTRQLRDEKHWLWRAVDQGGFVLELPV